MTRRDRARQQHEHEILEAAERLFCSKGYHACSMQMIAAEAEFSVGALYNFFASKEDIYVRTLVRKILELLTLYRDQTPSSGPVAERLLKVLEVKAEFGRRHSAFLRFYVTEMQQAGLDPGSPRQPEIKGICDQHRQWLTEIMRDGVAAGELQPLAPELLARSFMALSNAFFIAAHEEATFDAPANDEILQLFLRGAGR